MKEQIITLETAILAKEKGFNWYCFHHFDGNKDLQAHYAENGSSTDTEFRVDLEDLLDTWNSFKSEACSAPTQSTLQKFIREQRGVHIEIHRNASGYYWSMCRADGGTSLGWSDHAGPNLGGKWDTFEDALENALQVQLSYDLPVNKKVIKHWGNYVEFALKHLK